MPSLFPPLLLDLLCAPTPETASARGGIWWRDGSRKTTTPLVIAAAREGSRVFGPIIIAIRESNYTQLLETLLWEMKCFVTVLQRESLFEERESTAILYQRSQSKAHVTAGACMRPHMLTHFTVNFRKCLLTSSCVTIAMFTCYEGIRILFSSRATNTCIAKAESHKSNQRHASCIQYNMPCNVESTSSSHLLYDGSRF